MRLKHPFSCIISGGSGSGKTRWVYNLLKNRRDLIHPHIGAVHYYYTEYQDGLFEKMRRDGIVNSFVEGLPTVSEVKELVNSRTTNNLIVIDDNMKNVNSDLSELFTTFRHRDASVIFLTQNLFLQNKDYRTMSLNSNYVVIMKNPRDQSQIISFAKQFAPYNTKYVVEGFHHATSNRPYSYMLFDLKQETNDCVRMRTRIFPEESPMCVYMRSM